MTSTFAPSPTADRSELNTDQRSELNTPAAEDTPAPGEVTLPGQYVRVFFDDDPEGFVVRTQNRDRIAWERTTRQHKWGSAQDAPNLFIAFATWSAAKRDGQTTLPFAEWEQAMVDYDLLAEAPARPTR